MFRRGKYLLLIVAAVGTAAAHARVPLPSRAELGEAYVPDPEVARAAAFGFDDLMSDYHWLQAVQIVGGDGTPSEHGDQLGRLVDVATRLDPWIDHPYRFAAIWLTGSRAQVNKANELLARGISYHPRDWRNRFHLAFNHFFYLDDAAGAAAILEAAIALPGAPPYLGRLSARLRAQTAGLEAAALFLRELVQSAPDGFARAEYEKALDEIAAERRARFLDDAREEFKRRAGRDIETVGELARGPYAPLRRLPPEPNGWAWTLDPETGRIVSSYYGKRYEPHRHPVSRRVTEAMRESHAGEDAR